MSRLRIVLALIAALPFACAQAQATDLPGTTYHSVTTDKGVTFTIAPFYGWIPGTKGTVGVFGTRASVDVTPIDILKNIGDFVEILDGLYIGAGEIRYGRVGFLYDVFYLNVSVTKDIDRRFISGGLDVRFRQSTTTLAGTYRVMQSSTSHLDLIAGLRIWDVKTDLGVNLNIASGVASDGSRWVDPIIGVKGRTAVSPKMSLSGWALIGGAGVGSDLTWDLYGGVNYEVRKGFELSLGFRAMSADYQDGDFIWDVTQYGPLMGATFIF